MNTHLKKIQTRLSREGFRVSLPQLREVYPGMVTDADNPTDTELEAVKQHFMTEQYSGDNPMNEPGSIELSGSNDVERIGDELTDYQEPEEEKTSNALTAPSPEMRGIVNYKASQMGIELAASEVDVIASQIETVGVSFTETLSQIEAALNAFIGYQQSSEASQVSQMYQRVTDRITEKNQATVNLFASETKKFKTALEVAEEQRKSELSKILNRLRVAS
jgi:hypothetical protein